MVTFPDLPEAITQGDDAREALAEAADALEETIAGRSGAMMKSLCLEGDLRTAPGAGAGADGGESGALSRSA